MTDHPILSPFNRMLLGVLGVATVAGFAVVPLGSDLPIHWGLSGEPDNFAPATVALLTPAGIALVVVGLLAILRPAGLRRDFEAGWHVIDASIGVVVALALAILGATIAIGLGYGVDVPRLISAILGLQLMVLGNMLPKTRPNWIAGVRLPWTLRDPDNWRVTHRWTGRLMMLGGLVALLAALLGLPTAVLLAIVIAAVLGPVLIGTGISYTLARRSA